MKGISVLVLAIAICACSSNQSGLTDSASKVAEQITCENSQSALFDVIYESLQKLRQDPSPSELQVIFKSVAGTRPELKTHEQEFLNLINQFYQIIQALPAKDLKEKLQKVAAAEIGLKTSDEEIEIQKKLSAFETQWKKFSAKINSTCPEDEQPGLGKNPVIDGNLNLIAYGARKALATAYQSCSADEKKPMTSDIQNVKGISIVGTHPDGIGSRRVISDIDALEATDYYYQGITQGSNCKDTRKYAMIYDYGGKPQTDSGNLNFFANDGDGTSVLGIDCSAYVFSAIATAGLRLAPGKTVKAALVHGLSSHAYLDPESNGLSCFSKVKMGVSGSLKQGDIAAVGGHVLIIERVGSDPLGISKATSVQDCEALTAADFDFVVAQSSPSKEGIGINKYEARDYLPEAEKMRVGFVKYAQDACRARLLGKDQQMVASNFQIIRHKMTDSCRTSKPIALAGESCVAKCPTLTK